MTNKQLNYIYDNYQDKLKLDSCFDYFSDKANILLIDNLEISSFEQAIAYLEEVKRIKL